MTKESKAIILGITCSGKVLDTTVVYAEYFRRILAYRDAHNRIGYICQSNTPGERKAIRSKTGYKRREAALRASLNAMLRVEYAMFNQETVADADIIRLNRSMSHIFGKLRYDWTGKGWDV